jgi:hypothetical protein
MAMKKCKECGKEVSTTAKICPHCGVDNPVFSWNLIGIVVLGVIIWVGWSFLGGDSKKTDSGNKNSTSTTTDYRSCNIPKKDGSYETARCNDLEELCNDYIFYRKKILQANQEGDTNKVNEYRAKFQQVNTWLSQYNESDVQNTFSRLEGR